MLNDKEKEKEVVVLIDVNLILVFYCPDFSTVLKKNLCIGQRVTKKSFLY